MTRHGHHHPSSEVHEHDLGLQHDVDTLRRRRRGLFGIMGGLGAATLTACAADSSSTGSRPAGGGPGMAQGSVARVQQAAHLAVGDSDGIFADGYSLQLATVTGSVEEGLVAMLDVPI